MKKMVVFVLIFAMLSTAVFAGGGGQRGADGADANWPTRPITVVVPASAGGGMDLTARLTNMVLDGYLGGTTVVSNVVGAGTTLASRQVRESRPDGYTILYVNEGILTGKLNHLVDYSFEAFKIAGITAANLTTTFVTSNRFPTFQDFVSYARANPGQLRWGQEVGGWQTQFAAVMMHDLGIDIQIIDVGPPAEQIAALAGGHVDMIVNPYGLMADYIDTGMFIPHGVINAERSPVLPHLPTLREIGVDFIRRSFFAYYFPIDTPDAIVNRFTAALIQTSANQEFQDSLNTQGFTPYWVPPNEAVPLLEASYREMEVYQRILDEYEASLLRR